jgi:hypothetical protein
MVLASLSAAHAAAQSAPPSGAELAKKLANPIADLASLPFQFNYDGGYGSQDGDRFALNVQPVIPFGVGEDWIVISRTILPIVVQDDVVPGTDAFGLGDVTQSLFLSPRAPVGGFTLGAGPVLLLPTATETQLGGEKWGAGPTGVALRQEGPWTYGMLANHLWSFAGDDDRGEVNATFLQPFLSYTTPTATTFVLNTEATYDWRGEAWSAPINLQVNQLLKLGEQPVQIGAGVRWWAESPDGGPEGLGFRVNTVLLFPR